MSAVEYRFLEPLDVLFLRGNRLFGDPGSFGDSLMPPWPSVAAGALRSMLLARDGIDLAAFAAGQIAHPAVGTPEIPGTFTVASFHLARRDVNGAVETLVAPPADLAISMTEGNTVSIRRLRPHSKAHGIQSSAPLPLLPVLAETERAKPAAGYWLRQQGWGKYLAGEIPGLDDLIESSQLWRIDPRVGVGLDASMRRASDGRLFSVQAVAMTRGVGFLVGVSGATLPAGGVLRLGGDGRAAAVHPVLPDLPQPDFEVIARSGRCRIVLTTPSCFPEGWKPLGVDADNRVRIGEVAARLVCAAVPRAEVISGWDLAAWSQGKGGPKPALRAAPAGSVYWLENLNATPEALYKLVDTGLWNDAWHDAQRRAEGFNRFTFAAY